MARSAFTLPENFWRSLIAVLAGNAIYFSVQGFLPPKARHEPYAIDWGLAVDFWMCLVCYGVVSLIHRYRNRARGHQ